MEPPYFPVDMSAMKANFQAGCQCPDDTCDGSMRGILAQHSCQSIPLNHPNGGFGFKFTDNGKTFVFLSDNEIRFTHPGGLARQKYVEFCHGADLVFHDAQYTEEEYQITRGWGHSTYADATQLALDANVKSLGLFHHDPDRTDDALDRHVDFCREMAARARSPLQCFAASEGQVIHL
jgi:ribonuclease BN (tRNA processing enzyme)